jgi:bifunctional ADP-heptose synthase (sugar kinase/adenylyltransferase)
MYKILVVGDSCIDVYQYGTVDRLSPEAPVPVVKIVKQNTKLGMANNVKDNLVNLGCQVDLITTTTRSTKTRIIDIRSKQHIARIDDNTRSLAVNVTNFNYDAIVISDYNYGCVDSALIVYIRQNYSGPIFVDTKKKDLAKFTGCFVKINKPEFEQAISLPKELIVTLGEEGARYKDVVYKAKSVEVVDICGAGDTFLAALCFKYLNSNGDLIAAIKFANSAASITVQHSGVYAPRLEEICV